MSEPTPSSAGNLDLDLSGRQIGDYRLLRRLGRGAMAEVYLAEQVSLRRQVAFKILKRELAKDATYVRRFQMEAQAAAALVHAHIVQIHEVGCVDGLQYIAQEYVAGQNLRELMVRRLPDAKLIVSIMRQTAAALAKAADQGIVHRDIKPENIMLTRAGEVKVADFGLARISGDGDSLNLTQTGMTMGTPLYMSPEQVEGRPLDPRSDIYSFGITCYQMLAGEPPFRGETAISVALQHVKAQPERLENRRPDVPAGLCRIVHKMLAKDPKDRYADARELLRELRGLEIDGLAGEWPVELDERNTIEAAALAESTIEATRRLGSAMKTQALAIQGQRRWWRGVALVLAAAFLVGAGSSFLLRKPFLLAATPERDTDKVEKQKTAEEQYFYAVETGTEAGWKSVRQFFPDDKRWPLRADQQLAQFYLEHDRFDDALKFFEQFAAEDSVEKQYRAFGLAGECIVYFLKGNQRESAKAARDLAKVADGLSPEKLLAPPIRLDRQMVQWVGHAIRKNLQLTDQQKNPADWEKWLESRDPAPTVN